MKVIKSSSYLWLYRQKHSVQVPFVAFQKWEQGYCPDTVVSSEFQNINFFVTYHFKSLNKLGGLCTVLFTLGTLYLWIACFLSTSTRERLINWIWFVDKILSNMKGVHQNYLALSGIILQTLTVSNAHER